jgi:hypothetical protein
MCTVLLPPGDNPTAVNKYIIYHIIVSKSSCVFTGIRKTKKVAETTKIQSASVRWTRPKWSPKPQGLSTHIITALPFTIEEFLRRQWSHNWTGHPWHLWNRVIYSQRSALIANKPRHFSPVAGIRTQIFVRIPNSIFVLHTSPISKSFFYHCHYIILATVSVVTDFSLLPISVS